ncbi:CLUMA_CG015698, isoform A [Clunio marinus]|uniref:CLUMA_CG015698, isoform A n=1 Tax=Clunio marinus TaxID=568069 RepID=A0A1J1ISM8_9DIPT|nr:CLUMA_CG015698, isoform A [Clunio marinus]
MEEKLNINIKREPVLYVNIICIELGSEVMNLSIKMKNHQYSLHPQASYAICGGDLRRKKYLKC